MMAPEMLPSLSPWSARLDYARLAIPVRRELTAVLQRRKGLTETAEVPGSCASKFTRP